MLVQAKKSLPVVPIVHYLLFFKNKLWASNTSNKSRTPLNEFQLYLLTRLTGKGNPGQIWQMKYDLWNLWPWVGVWKPLHLRWEWAINPCHWCKALVQKSISLTTCPWTRSPPETTDIYTKIFVNHCVKLYTNA